MKIYILEETCEDIFRQEISNCILAASTDINNIVKLLPQYLNESKEKVFELYDNSYHGIYDEDFGFNVQLNLIIYGNPDNCLEYDYKNVYSVYKSYSYEYGIISNDLYSLVDKKELSMLFSLSGHKLDSFEYENDVLK